MALKSTLLVTFLTVMSSNANQICFNKALLSDSNLNFRNEDLKRPNITQECESQGICNDVPNYPEDLVKRLLTELEKKNITKCIIENHHHDYESELLSCTTKDKMSYPRAARNIKGIWQYILNFKSGRIFQAFQVDICTVQSKTKCQIDVINSNEYEIICNQKEVYKLMVYLNLETKQLDFDYFAVPNCCSCSLRS